MAKGSSTYQLNRHGSSRLDRDNPALHPDQALIDGRKTKELMAFAYQYAAELKYFNFSNLEAGNWQTFWEDTREKGLDELETMAVHHPHLHLFLCFLHVFGVLQKDLNQLLDTHLRFYYERVLQFRKQEAKPDQVHVIFELAKQAKRTLIEADKHLLDGGKDENGNPILFQLENDILVSHGKVKKLQSILQDEDWPNIATQTNTADGLETALEEGESWSPFGQKTFPKARMGFAIASSQLLLKEGKRTITINLTLKSNALKSFTDSDAAGLFECYLSGAEEWIGPINVSFTGINQSGNIHQLQLIIELGPDMPPVSFYDEAVFQEHFDTIYPILKLISLPSAKENFAFYQAMARASVHKIGIFVEATGIRELVLENDQGPLDPAKPFMPFGAQPVLGSSFYIGAEEPLLKELESLTLNFSWLDAPVNFSSHYHGYPGTNNNPSFKVAVHGLENQSWSNDIKGEENLFHPSDASRPVTIELSPNDGDSTSDFTRILSAFKGNRGLIRIASQPLLSRVYFQPQAQLFTLRVLDRYRIQPLQIRRLPQLRSSSKAGFIRFRLKRDFLHKQFPEVYTLALIGRANKVTPIPPIPKPPYTPTISEISLSYKSKELAIEPNEIIETNFEDRGIQLFHLHPFGQTERHANLLQQTTEGVSLAPDFSKVGELFIGLEEVEPGEAIQLLFQVEAGSANPEGDPPAISWSVLSGDHWQTLDNASILEEGTNGLLRSGVIRLLLPSSASLHHTLMESGLLWLKASISGKPSSISKLIAIHTQGQRATRRTLDSFSGKPHLDANLLAKLKPKIGSIKSVLQPYPSAFGKAQEADQDFFIRVSERLRHKNRGVSIWDYERLVLAEFPEVYQVKCLPHYAGPSCHEPGTTTLIVIPDWRKTNVFNPLEPKVDKDTLERIEQFLSKKTSPFATIIAKNPAYEKVKVDFEVKLRRGYDFQFFQERLNEAIIDWLSPWNKATDRPIQFGGKLFKSSLIQFVEQQESVDFISEFRLIHFIGNQKQADQAEITPSTPESIFVSVDRHDIREI